MLALQTYRFWVGRKIPFSDWPEIIQTFFNKQSLRYNNFLYYFEDNHGGLPKIMKDCPQVGPIRMRTTNIGETFYLSNIEADTECTESDIMSLMPKIYRRYGFSETHNTTLALIPYTSTGPATVNNFAPVLKTSPSACVKFGPIYSCSVRTKF